MSLDWAQVWLDPVKIAQYGYLIVLSSILAKRRAVNPGRRLAGAINPISLPEDYLDLVKTLYFLVLAPKLAHNIGIELF